MSLPEKLGAWLVVRWVRRQIEEARMGTVNQPTVMPSRKVTAAGGGGLVASLVIIIAAKLGVDLSPEEAAIFAAAVATAAGYFFRENR